ncbi:MAG: hypothetical protein Q4F99_06825, partial [bacterium]|nr:hypothetical protein [bacterium]
MTLVDMFKETTIVSNKNPLIGKPYGKTVGLAILAYNAPITTEASIRNHQSHGLYQFFDDVVVCFQCATDDDVAMAKRCGVRYVTREDNLGIQGGFRWAWETLKTDYILILENDIPVCVSNEVLEAQLKQSLRLLVQKKVDLVRLRNRFNPGEQNRFASMYSRFWPVHCQDSRWRHTERLSTAPNWLKALRRFCRPGKAIRWCGRSPYIEQHPDKLFPNYIEVIEPDFFCVDSWVLPWTNQATLLSKNLMGMLLDYADAHKTRH